MKIAKEFRWEMGHRLPLHDGACRNLHGHTYKAVVTLSAPTLNHYDFLVDFKEIAGLSDLCRRHLKIDGQFNKKSRKKGCLLIFLFYL